MHLRNVLPKAAVAIAIVTAVVVSGTATGAAAAPAQPGNVIAVAGQSFPAAPLAAAKKYVTMDDSTNEIRVLPKAKTALSASTYHELTALIRALNAADAALRTSTAPVTAAATSSPGTVVPFSACTNRFHYSWGSPLKIYIPDCMAYGFVAAVGGPAALAAFLFSEIGPLEWAAAAAVASGILAVGATLAAWAGYCDIFGPGNGVRFDWHWAFPNSTIGYPGFGCW